MLRASIAYQGRDGDLRAVTEGTKGGDSGVDHGEALLAFVEASLAGDAATLATARDALRGEIGSAGLVDAAAVIGNFQRMVRIADGAGIDLDAPVALLSEGMREDIGLDAFGTAERIERVGWLGRSFGGLVRGAADTVLRIAGRRARARQTRRDRQAG